LTTSLLESITISAQLTGLLLNEVEMSYTQNLRVISLVMLTFILDILLIGFLEISYHIPSVTSIVMDAYKVEHVSNIRVYEFEHVTKQGGICVIMVCFLNLVGFMD